MLIFDTREDMVSNLVPKNGVYAEIGVFKGEFSEKLLHILNPKSLFLLDLFEGVTCSGNADGNNLVYTNMEDEYLKIKEKEGSDKRICVLKGDSSSNLRMFPQNFLDMIYIDGDHTYEGAKKDLEMAHFVVKPGGYIMGHDYEMNMNKAQTCYSFGVAKAVNEFCEVKKQTICAKGMDGCVSFAIQLIK